MSKTFSRPSYPASLTSQGICRTNWKRQANCRASTFGGSLAGQSEHLVLAPTDRLPERGGVPLL